MPSEQYSERGVCEALPEESVGPGCVRQRARWLLDKLARRTKDDGERSIR